MTSKKTLEQLKESMKSVGRLYPILVDADTGETLDGLHREEADPNWERLEITITGNTEEEKELKRLQIKHISNWARRDIDKKAVLTEIAERTGWRGLSPFAKFLGISEDTISTHLPQKYKDELQSKRAKRPRSAKFTLAEKMKKGAEILKETLKQAKKPSFADENREEVISFLETAHNKLLEHSEGISQPELDDDAIIEDWLEGIEWNFSLWGCEEKRPEGFGDPTFHGNCSPTIIAAILKKYSSLDDERIFDPMAGSGTFIDVAKKMGYTDQQIIARDIRPLRSDVQYGDAVDTGLSDNSVDLIFAHFPYWNLIEYTTDSPLDASRFSYNDFLHWSKEVITESYRILKPKKYFVVMIGNRRKQGIVDLESQISIIGQEHFNLWDKVIKRIRTWKTASRGQRMMLAVSRAKQHRYSVVNHDTILVFRKE